MQEVPRLKSQRGRGLLLRLWGGGVSCPWLTAEALAVLALAPCGHITHVSLRPGHHMTSPSGCLCPRVPLPVRTLATGLGLTPLRHNLISTWSHSKLLFANVTFLDTRAWVWYLLRDTLPPSTALVPGGVVAAPLQLMAESLWHQLSILLVSEVTIHVPAFVP